MPRLPWTKIYLDLDAPIDLPNLDLSDPASGGDYFRYVLSTMFEDDAVALHLFYHEADELVRICSCQRDASGETWLENLPMHPAVGPRVLRAFRRTGRRVWGTPGRRRGTFRVRREGQHHTLEFDSPHAWDVRILRVGPAPATLPYELVLSSYWKYLENSGILPKDPPFRIWAEEEQPKVADDAAP